METVEALFREADRDGDGRIGNSDAAAFFPRFGLATAVLGAIWQAVVHNPAGMARDEFQLSLRLISLLQRGAPMDAGTLQLAMTQSQPLPVVVQAGGGAAPAQSVPAAERAHYLSIWSKLLPAGGRLEAKDAIELFRKSGLPDDELNQIWTAADADKDYKLSQEEFIVAMHLVNQRRQALPAAHSSALPALQTAQAGLRDTLGTLSKEHDDSAATLARLRQDVEQLQEANAQLEAACRDKQSQLASTRAGIESAAAALRSEQQKAEALRASLAALEQELQSAAAVYAQTQREHAQATQALPQLEAQRALMEQQLQHMRAQATSNDDELVKLQAVLQSQHDMAVQYQHMLASQQAARDSMQQQIADQNRQLEAMAAAVHTQPHASPLPSSPSSPPAATPASPVPTASLFDLDFAAEPAPVVEPPAPPPRQHPVVDSPPPVQPVELVKADSRSTLADSKSKRNRPLSFFGSSKKDSSSAKKDSAKKDNKAKEHKAKEKKTKKDKKKSAKSNNGASTQLHDESPVRPPVAEEPQPAPSPLASEHALGDVFAAQPLPAAFSFEPTPFSSSGADVGHPFASSGADAGHPFTGGDVSHPFTGGDVSHPFTGGDASHQFQPSADLFAPPQHEPAFAGGLPADFNPFAPSAQPVDFSALFGPASSS